ncbi:neuropeptide S receptor-like [Saccostrea echinata]|uniref:neuropeptide S receptor-like n=1 Tax=Saccostrea echinata TaxID=191078 RepID=UPI002A831EDF|nr:neuropeptide S receptor-like [Saccostrea echinata]
MREHNVSTLLHQKNLSNPSNYPELHRDIFFWQVPQLILVTSLFLFIVIGNGCVLLALLYSENGRKTRMNFFIMHLAISDLLVGMVLVSQDIKEKAMIDFGGGSFLCKFLQYIKVVILYASTYVLVSLSIDRLDAVARPMRFSRREFRARVLISVAWILAFLFSLPTLVLFDVTERNVTYKGKNVTLCEPNFSHKYQSKVYVTLIALAAFIFPAIIITFCYCVIIFVICRSDSDVQRDHSNWTFQRQESLLSNVTTGSCRSNPSVGRSHIIERAKIRTVKMTFFIVLAFILCWSPYFGFMLFHVYEMGSPDSNTLKALTAFVHSLAPLNSAVNPIIYGVFSTRICQNLRRVPCLRHFVCCGQRPRRFGSRMSNTSLVEGYFLNDVSSLRRRQLSGSKWNSDLDHRKFSKRTSRPLLHRESSSLMYGQQKPESPTTDGTENMSPFKVRKTNDKDLNKKTGRSVPLLQRGLSEEDSEILRSYTSPKAEAGIK